MAALNIIGFWKNADQLLKDLNLSTIQLAKVLSDLSQGSVYAHSYENNLDFCEKLLLQESDSSSTVFAALFLLEYEGKFCGFLSANIVYESVEIDFIAVLKEYRRLGFGQKLFEALESKLKQENSKEIYQIILEVGAHNLAAIKFYENLGFNLLNKRSKYYRSIEDALIMKK